MAHQFQAMIPIAGTTPSSQWHNLTNIAGTTPDSIWVDFDDIDIEDSINDPWTDIELYSYTRPWKEGKGTWITFYARIQRHFTKRHIIASEVKNAMLTLRRQDKQLFSLDLSPDDSFYEDWRGGVDEHWVDEDDCLQKHSFQYPYFLFPDFTPGSYLFEFTFVPHEGNTVVLKYPVNII